MMKTILAAAAGLALALGSTLARADPPEIISYQGVLMQDGGIVVPDGLYDLQFKIFHQESGGTAEFEQTLQVQITDGLYNVLLSNNGPWVLTDAFSQSPAYIEVTVKADGVSLLEDVTLEPRQQVASVPFALNAAAASIDFSTPAPDGMFDQVTSTHQTSVTAAEAWKPLEVTLGGAPLQARVTIPDKGSWYVWVTARAHARETSARYGIRLTQNINSAGAIQVDSGVADGAQGNTGSITLFHIETNNVSNGDVVVYQIEGDPHVGTMTFNGSAHDMDQTAKITAIVLPR